MSLSRHVQTQNPATTVSEDKLSDDLCPDCQVQRLTLPTICTGFHTAANKNKVYQKCASHRFNKESPCSAFIWRDDLTPDDVRSETSTRRPCASIRCRSSSKSRYRHQRCIQSFCKDCCYRSVTVCRVSAHNAPPQARGAPSSPAGQFAGSSSAPVASSAATPLSPPPVVAGPFARMIAPAYAMKVLTQDFSYPRSSQAEMNALRKDSEARIWVKYWNHNDQGPLVFHPHVTSFPFFEPAKCEDMTQKLGAPCSYYDMLDLSHGPLEDIPTDEEVWISTSEPIRVTPNSTIYLRAPDVHSCLKLRSSSPRKRLDSSMENQEGSSPSKKTKLQITDLTQSDTEEDATTPPVTPSPSPSPSRNKSVLFCSLSFLQTCSTVCVQLFTHPFHCFTQQEVPVPTSVCL
ncbi:hypothetical protein R3P38DRAFT_1116616 [Favolaschia claudopus]|uniref:Uncharacterized protein n=1 Tax=Favolaschia claudopus TaxID=2862362 RepID=A0AAW0B9I8_9AGAR